MMQIKFDYPLPNCSDGTYHLTEQELVNLLEQAYERGKSSVVDSSQIETYTSTSSDAVVYETLDEFRYTECAYCGSFDCSDPDDAASTKCKKLARASFGKRSS